MVNLCSLHYKNGMGPITISVVDPVKIKGEDYTVILEQPVKTPQGAVTSYENWTVLNGM